MKINKLIRSHYFVIISKIRVNSLYVLLRKLPPPFGIGLMASDEILTDKLMRLHIPVDKDCCVQFKPTAMAMLRDAYSLFSKGKMKDEDEKFRKYLQDTYQMTNLEALKYVPQRILGKEKFLVEIAVARKIYLNFLKSKNRNDSAKQNIFVTPLILQEKSKNK
ncbi:hypothetical protein HZS_2575 [Henneguya salminicola]|nr:hypothetical protein HZS_2575 [Henneguya salminicola]